MGSHSSSVVRLRVLKFLIHSAQQLEVRPIVKYTALSLFADRFLPSLPRFKSGKGKGTWLLQPVRDSNLQLFALISIWISSKMHDSYPISAKSLKSFGDKMIKEQHFTTRDLLDAVNLFYQQRFLLQVWFNLDELFNFSKVLDFEIGASNTAFVHLEELFIQFKGVARIGELVNFEACMDIMDLLYEKEETSVLFSSPCSLAASTLVASYLITVPKLRWEFPVLSWVKFVTSCKEEDIALIVRDILKHVLQPSERQY